MSYGVAPRKSEEVEVTAETAKSETFGDRWHKAWPVFLGTTVYMLPLFLLWNKVDYPDSFGFRITAHGKTGVFESWWYSYVLARRHHFWDVVTFAYMWASIAGILWWAGLLFIRGRREKAKTAAENGVIKKGDAQ